MAIIKKCTICGKEFPDNADWKEVFDHDRECREADRLKQRAFDDLQEALRDCEAAGLNIYINYGYVYINRAKRHENDEIELYGSKKESELKLEPNTEESNTPAELDAPEPKEQEVESADIKD
jgi:LAS superfamily LD-carboxypeptidase LdcB